MQVTTAADDNFLYLFFLFFLFFRENKSWHFMWIVCLADDSHEMSKLVFSEKWKKKNWNVVCYKFCLVLSWSDAAFCIYTICCLSVYKLGNIWNKNPLEVTKVHSSVIQQKFNHLKKLTLRHTQANLFQFLLCNLVLLSHWPTIGGIKI